MGFYQKKPVVIEAIQWTGKNHREMFDFLTNYEFVNEFISNNGDNFYIDHSKVEGGLVIKTLEGEHIASIGDYIIKGIQGEFYPCKPDIFVDTYEPAEQLEHTKLTQIRETNTYVCSHCHKIYEGMPRSMTCISCNRIFDVIEERTEETE